jgi:hypothetical protein
LPQIHLQVETSDVDVGEAEAYDQTFNIGRDSNLLLDNLMEAEMGVESHLSKVRKVENAPFDVAGWLFVPAKPLVDSEHHGFKVLCTLAKSEQAVMLTVLWRNDAFTFQAAFLSELTDFVVLAEIFAKNSQVASKILADNVSETTLCPVFLNLRKVELLTTSSFSIFTLDRKLS